jgi:hypothetical protein
MCVQPVRSALPEDVAQQDILTIYDNGGEIVPLLEYLVGKLAGIKPAIHLGIAGGVTKKTASITLDMLMQPSLQTPWEILSGLQNNKHHFNQYQQQHYHYRQHSNLNLNLRMSHHI